MQYSKIQLTFTSKPMFQWASWKVRGIWITLVTFCAATENGGLIAGGRHWTTAQWDALFRGLTAADVEELVKSELASWDQQDNLVINGYDCHGEGVSKLRASVGQAGGIKSGETRRSKNEATLQPPNPVCFAPDQVRSKIEAQPTNHPTIQPSNQRAGGEGGGGWLPDDDGPKARVDVIKSVRPPVSDLDHVRHAGAIIGKDEIGAWQLLVDEHGLDAVCEAARKAKDTVPKPFRSEVARFLEPKRAPPSDRARLRHQACITERACALIAEVDAGNRLQDPGPIVTMHLTKLREEIAAGAVDESTIASVEREIERYDSRQRKAVVK